MRWGFVFKLAWQEFKSNWKKSGFLILSIFLGVASLVAINSFSENLQWSVEMQSKNLKGSDLSFSSNAVLADSVQVIIDSLVSAGMEESQITQFLSMALNPKTGDSRLVQVRATKGNYPYYGAVVTEPESAWTDFKSGKKVAIDMSLRYQLKLELGDSVKIGEAYFTVAGFVKKMPGDSGFGFGSAGKIYFHSQYLEETNLVQFGSRVRYITELKSYSGQKVDALGKSLSDKFRNTEVNVSSYINREQMLGNAIDRVGNFLGLISLIALLLGGIGVASSINVYIRKKLDTVSVLRCLGATSYEVAAIYLLVSVSIGILGIILGILTGIGIQFALPALVSAYLPIDLIVFISWSSIFKGFAVGLIISVLFSLFPLSKVLFISPLNALRRDLSDTLVSGKSKPLSILLGFIFLGTIWAFAVEQADSLMTGTFFSLAILVVLGILVLIAWGIVKTTKLIKIRKLPYPVRQGLSNLFRPNNQTVTLVLALGFGVFLIMTIYQIQRALLGQLELGDTGSRPNMILFDIQKTQKDSLQSIFDKKNFSNTELLPIIPARYNGISKNGVIAKPDSSFMSRPRSEYMVTYRWDLLKTETISEGNWWKKENEAIGPEVSVSNDIAARMGIKMGDQIVFDVLGVEKTFTVTSFRKIDWMGLSPNFVFVMKPGVLELAPQTFITSLHIDGTENRSQFQRELVSAFPNVMAIDLTLVLETVDNVLSKISIIIRFMGFFSVVTGLIVVIGAISNGKRQRLREAALLRTVGAVKILIQGIFSIEFVVLGILASFTGILLSGGSAQLLFRYVFEIQAPVEWGLILTGTLLTATLMLVIGWLVNGGLFRHKPLEVLREE
ncbi:MAG: ABC transporter permease [Bacteroidetes bacterium]|nr:ABC transporter permease [Bacteroidota bacterium]